MASEETLAPTQQGTPQREASAGRPSDASLTGEHRPASVNNVLKALLVLATVAFLGHHWLESSRQVGTGR